MNRQPGHFDSASVLGHGVLLDGEILELLISGQLIVTPMLAPEEQVGPMSIDLRLGTEFIVKEANQITHIDPVSANYDPDRMNAANRRIHVYEPGGSFVLHPGQFALGSTLEYVRLPANVAGLIEGRSSWAREGLQVHSTASFIQPGSSGVVTLELQNMGAVPILLYPGSRVAQLGLLRSSRAATRPYSGDDDRGKYTRRFGSLSVSIGRFWSDIEFEGLEDRRRNHEETLRRVVRALVDESCDSSLSEEQRAILLELRRCLDR